MGDCNNDLCLPTKKIILATKKIIEEIYKNNIFLAKINKDKIIIDETYTLKKNSIIPKRGIFPTSILTILKNTDFPEPLKIMIFINPLNVNKQEITLFGGWTFGTGADSFTEDIYVKLLEVVFHLKKKYGIMYQGNLTNKKEMQKIITEFLNKSLVDYQKLIKIINSKL